MYIVFRLILDTNGIIMRNKNHIYCVFRIIFDTHGIIMRNKNHIYLVSRLILDTYGIIMKINIIYILCFSDYFRHLWNYNKNEIHIYCDFRIILSSSSEKNSFSPYYSENLSSSP